MEKSKLPHLLIGLVGVVGLVGMSTAFSGCGGSGNDPQDQLLNSPYGRGGHEGSASVGVTNFKDLINNYAQAKPKREPWAAHWWPYTANGIAAATYNGSPAGKYDAARGNTTHAQQWEV